MDAIEYMLTRCKAPKGQIKTRGLHCHDLLNGKKFKTSNRGGKGCHSRPQFEHPKFLHILIDRANGFGCKTIAKRHGATPTVISKFLKSSGWGKIKPREQLKSNGEKYAKDELAIYEEEWMKEVQSVKKDKTWARHPAVQGWISMKNIMLTLKRTIRSV